MFESLKNRANEFWSSRKDSRKQALVDRAVRDGVINRFQVDILKRHESTCRIIENLRDLGSRGEGEEIDTIIDKMSVGQAVAVLEKILEEKRSKT